MERGRGRANPVKRSSAERANPDCQRPSARRATGCSSACNHWQGSEGAAARPSYEIPAIRSRDRFRRPAEPSRTAATSGGRLRYMVERVAPLIGRHHVAEVHRQRCHRAFERGHRARFRHVVPLAQPSVRLEPGHSHRERSPVALADDRAMVRPPKRERLPRSRSWTRTPIESDHSRASRVPVPYRYASGLSGSSNRSA